MTVASFVVMKDVLTQTIVKVKYVQKELKRKMHQSMQRQTTQRLQRNLEEIVG